MNSQIKISIPEPCHEDWNKMIPNKNGRFCESCSKTVVDFTTMLPDDIKNYFLENRGKSICGRIKQSQLDSIIIKIPSSVLYSQTNYHYFFLLALFAVMGTTLFSCADKNGNKQKIDKIEIVEDTNNVEMLDLKSINSEKVSKIKFSKPGVISCGEIFESNEVKNFSKESEVDTVYYGGIGIEVKADFVGGVDKFYSFIKQNYKIPLNIENLKGEIRALFVIEKDGSLSTITHIKDIGFGTGEELKRVLLSSPKWYPGEQNGKRIRERFEIRFIITQEIIKRKFWFPKNVAKIDSLQLKIS
jgi:hypothetical protein